MNKTSVDTSNFLKRFCAVNDIRSGLSEPFNDHEHYYATNGHIAIKMPRSYCPPPDFLNYQTSGHPNINKIIDVRDNYKPVTLEEIATLLTSKEIPDLLLDGADIVTCPTCHGSKYTICTCPECDDKHDTPCGECIGKGELRRDQTYIFYKPRRQAVEMPEHGVNIAWVYLNLTREAMEFFGGEWEISTVPQKADTFQGSPVQFRSDNGIYILVMPLRGEK